MRVTLVTNEIVADQLHAAAERLGQRDPAVPVVLRHAVLDRHDRVLLAQLLIERDHPLGVELLALARQLVGLAGFVPQLAGRDVERDGDVLAGLVAGLLDRVDDDAQRGLGAGQVGGEAALVTDGGRRLAVVQQLLQGVEHLGAGAQRLGEGRQPLGDDHELLEVERVVGVGAAVDDVHQRHGQHARAGPAQITVKRHVELGRGGARGGQRHAQDRVGARPWPCSGSRRPPAWRRRGQPGRTRRGRSPPGRAVEATFSHALRTPLPPKRFLSPSRSSRASCSPVEAPDGTAAMPTTPVSSVTSTSTVGFPRESRISRARTLSIMMLLMGAVSSAWAVRAARTESGARAMRRGAGAARPAGAEKR